MGMGSWISPFNRQVNVFNRWKLIPRETSGCNSGINVMDEQREGGQPGFDYDRDQWYQQYYGIQYINPQIPWIW